jgi:anti-anti-sigma regulatory factor
MATGYEGNGLFVVALPAEPERAGVLARTIEAFWERPARDVAVDLGQVGEISSATLTQLLVLRRVLLRSGHRIILLGISEPVRQTLAGTGLDTVLGLGATVRAPIDRAETA